MTLNRSDPVKNSGVKKLVFAVAAVGAGTWLLSRIVREAHAPAPVNGGMKTGFDPSEINLESRFEDEGERPRDVVDQAIWESFIASDPPAY